jgi:radical SAM protein with 4Fe4S-binding SPASM domain
MNWIGYIHPAQAIILSMFTDINISLKNKINNLSKYFHISESKVFEIIAPYIQNKNCIYTEFAGNRILFPENVLLFADNVLRDEIKYNIDIKRLQCKIVDLTPDRMHKSPLSLLFILTTKCVTNCKYCYADKIHVHNELCTNDILNIIEEAKMLDMGYINIIGGEVLCKKDWNIILSALIRANLTPQYISTKVPINRILAEKLYQTGYNNVIQISLDSLNINVLSQLISSNIGYIDSVKKGINILQEYGFKIQIDTILTKYNSNIDSMMEMYKYIKTIHNLVYWEIRVPDFSIYRRDAFSKIKAQKKEIEDCISYVKEQIIPSSPIEIHINDKVINSCFFNGKEADKYFEGGQCSVLKNKLFVLPDGKVSLCEELYWHPKFIVGDLKTQSIEEIWNSEKMKNFFLWQRSFYSDRKNGICPQCKVFDYCNMNRRKCWTRVLRAYGYEHWDYPDPKCKFAPPIISDMVYK